MAGQIDCSCEDDILLDGKLPGDVMVSILSNLPVKSLLKFKAVSKPWCSLISSPRFVKLHLRRQSVIANNLLIMLLKDDPQDRKFGLLPHNHHNKNCTVDNDVLILENSPLLSPKDGNFLRVVDSCNGLVCLVSCGGFILWNPATRKYRSLERPKKDVLLSLHTLGLCYRDATNDFKIVVWSDTYTDFDVRPYLFVYSMSSDSWEKLDYDAERYPIDIEPPTFTNGCLHWLADTSIYGFECTCSCIYSFECTCSSGNVIVAYDVTDGAMSDFRCFRLPDICGCHDSRIRKQTLAIRGCLSIVLYPKPQVMESDYELEVWVMEEYGVEGSWVKLFTIRGIVGSSLISWNDGFIWDTDFSRRLTFYDLNSKNEYYLDFMSFRVDNKVNYVESLAAVEAEEGIASYQLIEG